ncbi:MAG: Co2+/Mg2+ efflux protein ApaG [Gammaproteobacteria bacterium]|nr:Co2+/Mg2+ efflux protein ApaG [Gammaproteobacteria bacterium]MCW8910991.1 Co2+/Mg2+ efflux protein ApaG [Gammaproteobacteria bacterium]MCW9004334.1 Co2+/Mg2+ efflux protein ApaG [Gammaproteobacteria bacterium]MCW9056813.1 Co2+/Mg2+ efflux protein ApaG [Gammaproteobacteria bacterium]
MNINDYKINIEVIPAYIEDQSNPAKDHYVFSYTVTIINDGSVPAKLLTRHWIIRDAHGETQEVKGDGVVGEQPYLKPGEGFQYTSGTLMKTPTGSMSGSYQMITDDGHQFAADIPEFYLVTPNTLH